MIWITKRQVLLIHSQINNLNNSIDGIRSLDLLESALSSPFQTYMGEELFPSIIDKSARLGYGLTQNHPFFDGNKRIGIHSMLLVLELNDIKLNYTQQELIEISLSLASGKSSYEDLRSWIIYHAELPF